MVVAGFGEYSRPLDTIDTAMEAIRGTIIIIFNNAPSIDLLFAFGLKEEYPECSRNGIFKACVA